MTLELLILILTAIPVALDLYDRYQARRCRKQGNC